MPAELRALIPEAGVVSAVPQAQRNACSARGTFETRCETLAESRGTLGQAAEKASEAPERFAVPAERSRTPAERFSERKHQSERAWNVPQAPGMLREGSEAFRGSRKTLRES